MFMPCSASAGAAETANGAVARMRMVLFSFTNAYYTKKLPRNLPRNLPRENDVFPVEAKAGINTKAKSLRVYRELFNPPYAIRTSLQPYHDGEAVKDIPLYAFGIHVSQLLSPARCRGRVYTPATSG